MDFFQKKPEETSQQQVSLNNLKDKGDNLVSTEITNAAGLHSQNNLNLIPSNKNVSYLHNAINTSQKSDTSTVIRAKNLYRMDDKAPFFVYIEKKTRVILVNCIEQKPQD